MWWPSCRWIRFEPTSPEQRHTGPRAACTAATAGDGPDGQPGRSRVARGRPAADAGRHQRDDQRRRAQAGRADRPRAVPRSGLHRRPGAWRICAEPVATVAGRSPRARRIDGRTRRALRLAGAAGQRPQHQRLRATGRLARFASRLDQRHGQPRRAGVGAGARAEPRDPAPHLTPDHAGKAPDAAGHRGDDSRRAGGQQKP